MRAPVPDLISEIKKGGSEIRLQRERQRGCPEFQRGNKQGGKGAGDWGQTRLCSYLVREEA